MGPGGVWVRGAYGSGGVMGLEGAYGSGGLMGLGGLWVRRGMGPGNNHYTLNIQKTVIILYVV